MQRLRQVSRGTGLPCQLPPATLQPAGTCNCLLALLSFLLIIYSRPTAHIPHAFRQATRSSGFCGGRHQVIYAEVPHLGKVVALLQPLVCFIQLPVHHSR